MRVPAHPGGGGRNDFHVPVEPQNSPFFTRVICSPISKERLAELKSIAFLEEDRFARSPLARWNIGPLGLV